MKTSPTRILKIAFFSRARASIIAKIACVCEFFLSHANFQFFAKLSEYFRKRKDNWDPASGFPPNSDIKPNTHEFNHFSEFSVFTLTKNVL